MPNLVKIGQAVLEKKFSQGIFTFSILLTRGKHLKNGKHSYQVCGTLNMHQSSQILWDFFEVREGSKSPTLSPS